MKLNLPNLELLEYQAENVLVKEKDVQEKLIEHKMKIFGSIKRPKYVVPDLKCYMFPQMWGSTCTAFDVDGNCNAMFGGQAMTEAYTVVFNEPITETYIVFVDNKMCYMVDHPTDKFYEDFDNKKLKCLSVAKKVY